MFKVNYNNYLFNSIKRKMKNINNKKENNFKNLTIMVLSIIILISLAISNTGAFTPIETITLDKTAIYKICTCGGVCCTPTQYCESNVCKPKKEIGYGCANDYECLTGNCLGGTCKAGDACDINADCASGKYCGADNTCHGKKPNGEACNANYQCVSNNCYKNTICEEAGFCGEDADCKAGEYCGNDTNCHTKKDNDEICTNDNECKNRCIEGKCKEPTCGDDVCTNSEYCENNECKPKKAPGEACTGNEACVSNFCVHEICRTEETYCGDGFCDTGESISSCPDDCGECREGDTKTCTASNGCEGTQTCTDAKWSECTTNLKKCENGTCIPETGKCAEEVKADKKAQADSLMQQAQEAVTSGDYETAREKAGDAKEIYEDIGDVNSVSDINSILGNIENLDKNIFEKILGAILSPAGILIIILIILIIILFFAFKFLSNPAKISIKVNPDHIPANGKTSADIIVRILNKIGKETGAKEDIIVELTSGSGEIKPDRVTILKGKSVEKSQVTSSTTPEIVDITGNCEGLTEGKAKVTFTSVSARFCMHCGAKLLAEGEPCPRCGKLPPSGTDTKVCQNADCGEIIPKQARYCRKCGAAQP